MVYDRGFINDKWEKWFFSINYLGAIGWHHQLKGHEFGWTLGVGDGKGGLVCCDSWGHKESDTTERLNWTELMSIWKKIEILLFTYPKFQFQLQYRSKCEMEHFQLLEEHFWECLYEPVLGRISKQKTKTQNKWKTLINVPTLKLRSSFSLKKNSERQVIKEEKILQYIWQRTSN